MKMTSLRKKQKALNASQVKEIVNNVIKVCEEEASTGAVQFCLNQRNKRIANYTGLSGQTITKIRKESREAGNTKLTTPGKRRPRPLSTIAHLDYFGVHVVRNIITDFYLLQKGELTCSKLLATVKEKLDFPWGISTLKILLKLIGYRWKKCSKRSQVIIEHPNSVKCRFRYLKSIRKFREENLNIIYVGENCVDSSSACKKYCSMGAQTNASPSTNNLIILHATRTTGFIEEALLIFKVSQLAEYDHRMNCTIFEQWLTEMVLPNIPENSVIVLDNSPYSSVELNKAPTENATKVAMKEWLERNNISFGPEMYKSELFDLIKKYKNHEKTYHIDELLKIKGFKVLRLPPYTFELNPAEFAWDKVEKKSRVKNVTGLTESDLQIAIVEGMNSITTSEWNHFHSNVIKIENDYWNTDEAMETKMEKYTVNFLDSESSDSGTDNGSEIL